MKLQHTPTLKIIFILLPVVFHFTARAQGKDGCEKAFMPAVSVAWGTNLSKASGVQGEFGVWGHKQPFSFYAGVSAWTSRDTIAAKNLADRQGAFYNFYLKVGLVTFRGGEGSKLRNELTITIPTKASPELGYGIYYVLSPSFMMGMEPVYQFTGSDFGGYLRLKCSL